MLSYLCQQVRDFLARHSSCGEAMLMLLSFVPALLETKKLWKEIKEEKGFRKTKHWAALICCWLLPVIVFVSTRATDWSSEDAVRDVRVQSSNDLASAHKEIFGLSNQLIQTQSQLDAIKPKPFKERLIDCLNEIDAKIIPSLRAGNRNFNGGITATQYNDLEKLANESGAKEFIIVDPDVHMGIGMGSEGITYGVKFTVDPKLLDPE